MSYALERKIIEKAFKTAMNLSHPTVPIDYENIEFEQPSDMTWVRLTVTPGESFAVSVGSPDPNTNTRYRSIGRIYAQIHVPAGSGIQSARQLADDIAAIFRGQSVLESGQQIVYRAPEILQGETVAGWFRLTVSVPFQRDEFF